MDIGVWLLLTMATLCVCVCVHRTELHTFRLRKAAHHERHAQQEVARRWRERQMAQDDVRGRHSGQP